MNLENVKDKIWNSVRNSVEISVWDSVGKSVDGLHGSIIKEREQG
jgi:hypothetical protein